MAVWCLARALDFFALPPLRKFGACGGQFVTYFRAFPAPSPRRESPFFTVTPLVTGSAHAQSSASGADLGRIRLAGDEPSYLDLGAGAFNIDGAGRSSTAAEGRLELRYAKKFYYIGPAVGLLGNTRGGVFGYAGFYGDLTYGHFVLTPLAGFGGYHRGGSENLGGTFQFRLSADLAYQFDRGSRLGVQFAHISNANIHTHNPGENKMLLTLAIPLQLPF